MLTVNLKWVCFSVQLCTRPSSFVSFCFRTFIIRHSPFAIRQSSFAIHQPLVLETTMQTTAHVCGLGVSLYFTQTVK